MSNAVRILLALVAGLILGIVAVAFSPNIAETAASIADPVGTLWLNGLRMTIIPLVVALLVTGIGQTAEAARAGRLAGRAMIWFIAVLWATTIVCALIFPALLDLWPMPAESAGALKAALSHPAATGPIPTLGDFVRSIVPSNPISAAADNAILPLVVFATFFAFAVTQLPAEPRERMTGFFSALADTMLIIIGWVLRFAPLGVFALAFAVGARSGAAAFGALAHYVVFVSSMGILVGLSAYGVARVAGGVPIAKFARAVAPAQAVAISTQSSLATLPEMLRATQELGATQATAGVVLPLAVALFRATSPAMNLAVALYIAHWYGIALTPMVLFAGVATAAITTMGSVSLPGTITYFSSVAPVALAMGVPLEPLALLVAVETVPDIFRTLGNVTMDVAVTTSIARQAKTSDA
ncbi:dicarboxylate/amino acid:cation symporter [soil metagenome]